MEDREEHAAIVNPVNWTADTAPRPCPLCGGMQHSAIGRKMQHRLDLATVVCMTCGLVFTNPVPPRHVYERFYSEAYAAYYGHLYVRPQGPARTAMPERVRQWLDWIAARKQLAGSRLLEVGPGLGLFLWWARQAGADAIGLDPSHELCDALTQEGLPCLVGSLETADLEGPFDIIVMLHVLEHFYDPNAALARVRALLKDGGLVVVEVPNIHKPFRSLDRYFFRYVHLLTLSPATLSGLLNKHQFSVEFMDEGLADWRRPQSLFAIARKGGQSSTIVQKGEDWRTVMRLVRAYRVQWLIWGQFRWHLYQIRGRFLRAARRIVRHILRRGPSPRR